MEFSSLRSPSKSWSIHSQLEDTISENQPLPIRITVSNNNHNHIRSHADCSEPVNVNPKTTSSAPRRPPLPSPSTSRAKSLPDWSSDKKKSPENSLIDKSSLNRSDPFLFKLALDTITSGDGPGTALDYALCASKSFKLCVVDGELSLDLAMTLYVITVIYCSLGRFEEAILVLREQLN